LERWVLDVGGDFVVGREHRVRYVERVSCRPRPGQVRRMIGLDDVADGVLASGDIERFQSIFGHDPYVVHGRAGLGVAVSSLFDHGLELGPMDEDR
jgi:hypothetical protein